MILILDFNHFTLFKLSITSHAIWRREQLFFSYTGDQIFFMFIAFEWLVINNCFRLVFLFVFLRQQDGLFTIRDGMPTRVYLEACLQVESRKIHPVDHNQAAAFSINHKNYRQSFQKCFICFCLFLLSPFDLLKWLISRFYALCKPKNMHFYAVSRQKILHFLAYSIFL